MRECKLQSFAHLPNFAKDEMKNNFGVIFPMMLIGIQQKTFKESQLSSLSNLGESDGGISSMTETSYF